MVAVFHAFVITMVSFAFFWCSTDVSCVRDGDRVSCVRVIAMVSSAFLLHFSGVGLCTGAAGVPDSPPGAAHKNATVQSCS